MRAIRRAVGAILLLVVVLAVVLVGAVFLLPGDRIAAIAADQIRARTGRAVLFSGDTSVSFYPVLGVKTGAVSVANADWSGNGPMFQAQGLTIGVDARALLGGDIRVTTLEALQPRILLEKTADGRANWDLAGLATAADGGSVAPEAAAQATRKLGLERAIITGAALRYVDAGTGTDQMIADVDMDLRLPDYDGPADLSLVLRPAAQDVQVTGRIETVAALADGKVSGLVLSIKAPGGTARFDGRASIAPEAQGKLALDLTDTSQFLAALGLGGASLPRGLGQSASLQGDVTYSAGRLSLRGATAKLDGNTLDLVADVVPGTVSTVTAQISAGALDLSALTGSDGSGGGAARGGWSTAPVDASALALVNGDITLKAASVDLGMTRLEGLDTRVTIDNSRAVAQIRSLKAYGGAVTGQLVANNRNGLSLAADVAIKGTDLTRLLSETAGITRFTGSADAALNVLTSGPSMQAWMTALSGKGNLSTGRGTITGIDLDRLFRTGLGTGGTTIFDATSASFTIDKGVLSNTDLSLKLASITATGKGVVDLGGRSLDYLFTPIVTTNSQGKAITIPVRISGPWDGPSIQPDLNQVIQMNLGDEKKALQDKARAEVRDKVQDALGVTKQSGETDEDALRRGLENKLKGLFDH